MRIIRRIARFACAWIFIYSGGDVMLHPEGRASTAAGFLSALRRRFPALPEDDVVLVRANAGLQLGGGLLLSSGRVNRLGAAVLAGTLVPTTLAGHPFWTIEDPGRRAQQRIHFAKNLSIFGGLVLLATAPRGR